MPIVYYIMFMAVFLCIILPSRKRLALRVKKRRRRTVDSGMAEMLRSRYLGKECEIAVDRRSSIGSNVVGTVNDAEGGWLKITDRKGFVHLINLVCVSHIKECAVNQKG